MNKYVDQFGNLTDEYYGYVYLIIDQKHNKVYIGQKKGKVEDSLDYYGSGARIRNIIKSRGVYLLNKIILGVCYNKQELKGCEKECKYFFDAWNPLVGYNIAVNDNGGDNFTYHPDKEKYKKNLSISCIGEKNGFYGRKHTNETKEKIGKANTNRKFTEESKKKMGDSHKGRKHTEESKKKMRDSQKGKVSKFKGKTYEEMYGVEKAKNLKEQKSKARIGIARSEDTKRKISESRKYLTDEARRNMSISQKNKKPTRWMKKDSISKMVLIENIQIFLDTGWKFGRILNKLKEENI